MSRLTLATTILLVLACGATRAAEMQTGQTVSPVIVVAPTPLAGPGVAVDKLPAATRTLDAADLDRAGSLTITDALEQRVAGISLSDAQGNGFARDLNYRGFQASPLQGTPQGLAVYLGGVRLNEAFGDTVNWDLIPEAAISRIDLVTGDPAFGLNALGGALNLAMKTGRDAPGGAASLSGGSFGRRVASLQYGASGGAWSVFAAADAGHDDGWRRRSNSSLARGYADLGWRGARLDLHLVAATGGAELGVVGPTPRDLLAGDRRATFTFPQTTRDTARLLALNGAFTASRAWSIQGNLYARAFRQRHLDGNDASLRGCAQDPADPLFATLCVRDDDFPSALRPPAAAFQVLGADGTPLACPPLTESQTRYCDGVAYGSLDRTRTRSSTVGASIQAVRSGPILGHGNVFAAGVSVDRGRARFSADSTLALIQSDLGLTTDAAVPGVGQVIRTAGAIAYNPVVLRATNDAEGIYATDTFDVTERLFLTLSARLNSVRVSMTDLTGASPALDGRHRFDRFNPAVGLAWKALDGLTVYGGYAETNRAPTPLELACSDPLRPCLLENALVADPPLRQVVSRSWQAGLRGSRGGADARLNWSLGVYRSDNDDDILALASAIQGRGSFANVPRTRRGGVEAEITYASARWLAYASASKVKATYRFAGALPSPNSPFADANGNIQVAPGDRIGGIPAGRFKAGGDLRLTPAVSLGVDALAVSAQRRVGDGAGLDAPIPAYWIAGAHAVWRLGHGLELFGRVDNLFDRRYATFGTYFDTAALDDLAASPLPAEADPRTDTPAPPRAFTLGLRARW